MIGVALDSVGRYAVCAMKAGDGAMRYAVGISGEGSLKAVYSSVDRVFEGSGVRPADVDAIVVNTGPGSWTGTRLGVTYAASVALGASSKVYGFTGFDIAAEVLGAGQNPSRISFIDQLGKIVRASAPELSIDNKHQPAPIPAGPSDMTVNLFPDISPREYLSARRVWLDSMLNCAERVWLAGRCGNPSALRPTYFQEFPAGVRK